MARRARRTTTMRWHVTWRLSSATGRRHCMVCRLLSPKHRAKQRPYPPQLRIRRRRRRRRRRADAGRCGRRDGRVAGIRTFVLGLSWTDLSTPCSAGGVKWTSKQLAAHLLKAIAFAKTRTIPAKPPVSGHRACAQGHALLWKAQPCAGRAWRGAGCEERRARGDSSARDV